MRRCEIDKIGVDLPCMCRAKHFLKIVSKHLGDKRKSKVWICDKHHAILQDKEYLNNLLDGQDESTLKESKKYRARISR